MTGDGPPPGSYLMTSDEVGALFRVDAKTVVRWANSGRLRSILTPGGHHRFWSHEVQALIPEGEPGRRATA
jgi:excisionase family DNA binding protein